LLNRFYYSNISVQEYQKLSDDVFDSLTDYLEEVVEEYDEPDADEVEVEYYVGASASRVLFLNEAEPLMTFRWAS
jgi:frataxin-like iron-binding protein CyaY